KAIRVFKSAGLTFPLLHGHFSTLIGSSSPISDTATGKIDTGLWVPSSIAYSWWSIHQGTTSFVLFRPAKPISVRSVSMKKTRITLNPADPVSMNLGRVDLARVDATTEADVSRR